MISFGNMPQRSSDWTWFKPLISSKSLVIQYEEDAGKYTIFGYDPPEALFCLIWKGAVPAGGDQVQNDIDKTDFETNFLPIANRSIDDIPSKIAATALKNGSSANLNVDGSVTPVVFSYNPPSDFDVDIHQLSLLFEDVTAFAFGNNFVRSGLATLANGLLLECKAADLSFTWQNMRRTRDIVEISRDFNIVTGTPTFMRANIQLPKALRLSRAGTYAQPDYIRLTVRDNLTTFDFAEAFLQGTKL